MWSRDREKFKNMWMYFISIYFVIRKRERVLIDNFDKCPVRLSYSNFKGNYSVKFNSWKKIICGCILIFLLCKLSYVNLRWAQELHNIKLRHSWAHRKFTYFIRYNFETTGRFRTGKKYESPEVFSYFRSISGPDI